MIEPRSVVHDVEGLLQRLRPILQSGWLTAGPVCQALEQRLESEWLHRPVVAVSHGTAALQLLIRNLTSPGCKVVVPVNTFSATLAAPLLEGHGLVAVDIDHEMQLSVDALWALDEPAVGAVLAVHIGGLVSSRWAELVALCRARGWVLLEDACQALGTTFDGRPAGSLAQGAAFSISPTKVIFAGQGGLAVVDDYELAGRMHQQLDNGKPMIGHDDVVSISGNYKLSDVEAAIFLHQWGWFLEDRQRRCDNLAYLRLHLPDVPFLTTRCEPNGYKAIAFVPDGLFFESTLARCGVQRSGACYRLPLHQTKAFAKLIPGSFPVAERLCAQHVGLPINWQFGPTEMAQVVRAMEQAVDAWEWASQRSFAAWATEFRAWSA